MLNIVNPIREYPSLHILKGYPHFLHHLLLFMLFVNYYTTMHCNHNEIKVNLWVWTKAIYKRWHKEFGADHKYILGTCDQYLLYSERVLNYRDGVIACSLDRSNSLHNIRIIRLEADHYGVIFNWSKQIKLGMAYD